MELSNIILTIQNTNWPILIFKVIAIITAVGFFTYSIIFQQQLRKMSKTASAYQTDLFEETKTGTSLFVVLSYLQVFLSFALLVFSLILL
jgi:hypothetical protein